MSSAPRKTTSQNIDWYVFSYRRLGRWVFMLLLLGAGGVWGYYLYRRSHESPQVRAERQIAQAESSLDSAQKSPDAEKFAATLNQARERLNDARSFFQQVKYDQSYEQAIESESLSRRAVGRVNTDVTGDATFVALDGEVTLQRAGRAAWEEARLRQALFDGDFVKTGRNGSAEIMFFDGTLFQLRPDSLFEVKLGQKADREKASSVEMVSGQIQVYTSNSPSSVKTKSVTAEIQRGSQIGMTVDAEKNTEVSNFRGTAVLRTEKESVVLSERERVTATAASQSLGAKIVLPEAPSPIDPADNRIFDLKSTKEVGLRWSPVKDADHYRLQVSRSRLFIPDATPLDLPDRRGTTTAIRPHDEGSYYWRVATVTRAGLSSDFSGYRRFRIVADASKLGVPSGAPPAVTLDKPYQMSNIFIITGRTDPSASVSVQGQRADVEPNGTFKATITIDREGFTDIIVKASDAAGRETVKKIPVKVEVY
jgi:hypothetical protein